MAENTEEQVPVQQEECQEEEDDNPDYKPPKPKSIDEILEADQEDESLRKYKEALLGKCEQGLVEPGNPSRVLVRKLALCVDDRPDIEIDLTQTKEEIKASRLVLKEGVRYRVKIFFHVQRDIVSGLRYEQRAYRKGIKVDTTKWMVGSYGPKTELQTYTTPPEDAPSGMLARGDYKIDSIFTDDDKNIYLQWEWHLIIKKEWE